MMWRFLLGAPALGLLVLSIFALMPCMATCDGTDEIVTATVRACPRAVELLGDDARPARLGVACGESESSGSYGHSSWSLPYTGSRGRGTVSFAARKQAGDWQLDGATLEVDGEDIDLLACTQATRRPKTPAGKLAQTNADAVHGKFDGKVTRSTHDTIKQGATCRGEVTRQRGSPFARVKVECDPGTAESSGTITVYDGTPSFMLDVQDPSRRDDDRTELDDSKTSEVDKTPGCRISSSGNKGTLTLWDSAPSYEIVVEL